MIEVVKKWLIEQNSKKIRDSKVVVLILVDLVVSIFLIFLHIWVVKVVNEVKEVLIVFLSEAMAVVLVDLKVLKGFNKIMVKDEEENNKDNNKMTIK